MIEISDTLDFSLSTESERRFLSERLRKDWMPKCPGFTFEWSVDKMGYYHLVIRGDKIKVVREVSAFAQGVRSAFANVDFLGEVKI